MHATTEPFVKRLVFLPVNDAGQEVVTPIRRAEDSHLKLASRSDLMPKVAEFIRDIRPDPRYRYVLINALGAGEKWGSNKNGDWFPEAALRHDGDDYGYRTFLKAGVYKHHVNKDKTKSAGDVVLSEYNPDMHRVELIVRFDGSKDPDVVRMIDDGQLFPVSMGCRVPSDFCSICGHESRTTADYCSCLTEDPGMNGVTEEGKRAFAINLQPHFFDISRVLVGADRTARSYGKIASHGDYPEWLFLPSGELAEKMGDVKGASIDKLIPADSVEVLSEPARELSTFKKAPLDALRGNPYAIDTRELRKVAHLAIGQTLSSFAALGIPLNAREFQYLALVKCGQTELAEALDRVGYRIQPAFSLPDPVKQAREVAVVDLSQVDPIALKLASAHVTERSVHLPFVLGRMAKTASAPVAIERPQDPIVPSLFKIAALYAAYLQNLAAFGPRGLAHAAALPEIGSALSAAADPSCCPLSGSAWAEKTAGFGDSHPVRDFVTGVLLSPAYDPSNVAMDADNVHRKIARALPELTSARIARLHPETSAWVTVLKANSMSRG